MNMSTFTVFSAILVAVSLTAGCGKKETADTTTVPEVKRATPAVTQEAPKTVPKPDDSAKQAEALKAAQAQAAKAQADQEAAVLKEKAAADKAAADKAVFEKLSDEQLALAAYAAAATVQKSQGLIETAQKLAGENKYTEALQVIKDLASLRLTTEQQKLVDNLKEQIKKAMADKAGSEADKAIGGPLNK